MISLGSRSGGQQFSQRKTYTEHLFPERARGAVESLLVGVDDRPVPHEIGLVRLDELGALDELPRDEKDRGNADHDVLKHEVSWEKVLTEASGWCLQ